MDALTTAAGKTFDFASTPLASLFPTGGFDRYPPRFLEACAGVDQTLLRLVCKHITHPLPASASYELLCLLGHAEFHLPFHDGTPHWQNLTLVEVSRIDGSTIATVRSPQG